MHWKMKALVDWRKHDASDTEESRHNTLYVCKVQGDTTEQKFQASENSCKVSHQAKRLSAEIFCRKLSVP